MKTRLLAGLLAAVSFARTSAGAPSDAERNNSAQMNAAPAQSSDVNAGGVRVVFIGNSITLHGSLPKIGWTNVWGMAASAASNDYVHIVTRGIEKASGRRADVRVRNLAAFERGFAKYDLSAVQDLVDFAPDYLIVALGENVPELKTEEERRAYGAAFSSLLSRFLQRPRRPVAVVRGVFWPSPWKDACMERAAKENHATFVKADVANDPSMKAIGLFWHSGVQAHPGDKGMAEIAKRILAAAIPGQTGQEGK